MQQAHLLTSIAAYLKMEDDTVPHGVAPTGDSSVEHVAMYRRRCRIVEDWEELRKGWKRLSKRLSQAEEAVKRVMILSRVSFARRALATSRISEGADQRGRRLRALPKLTRSKVGVVGQLAQHHRMPTISFRQPPHLTPRCKT